MTGLLPKSARSRKILEMVAVSNREKELMERLDQPSYESTKGTTSEEQNKALVRANFWQLEASNLARHPTYFTRSSATVNVNNDKTSKECGIAEETHESADSELSSSSEDYIPSCDGDSNSSSLSSSCSIIKRRPPVDTNELNAVRTTGIEIHNDENQVWSDALFNVVCNDEIKACSSTIQTSYADSYKDNEVFLSKPNLNEEQIAYSKIKRDNSGRRMRDKIHACYICHKLLSNNMARHFECIHGSDIEIAKILAMPKSSRNRREAFEEVIRAGDFYHNCEILNLKKGQLLLVRMPDENKSFTYNDFGPCPFCLGFMLKKYMWHHVKFNCASNKSSKTNILGKRALADSNALLFQASGRTVPSAFNESILSSLRSDEISLICKKDVTILDLGAFLFEKYGTSQKDLIRQSMRQLGRLTIELNKLNGGPKSLREHISPDQFDTVVTATRNISGSNYESTENMQEFNVPSLALKIGYLLRKCIAMDRGDALRKGDLLRNTKLKNFNTLMDIEWATKISSNALSTMYKRKMNSKELLPLTTDLQKLNKHLNEEIKNLTKSIVSSFNKQAWSRLASITLCKTILFNKRRSGEASRMTIENYCSRPKWTDQGTEEFRNSLTPLELKLASKLAVVEIMGKRGRKVPVILTKSIEGAIDLLLKTREECEIASTNPYIFARTLGSTQPLRGHDCLRRECLEAGVTSVESITSTKLRKYTATVCQIFNLSEHELDWLARHLGHDIRVHRNFYRLHENAVEVTKVSRLLLAIEKGQAHKFAGKNLDDINIEDMPDIEQNSEDEEEDEANEGRLTDKVVSLMQDENFQGSDSENGDLREKNVTPVTFKCNSRASKKHKISKKRLWSTDEKKSVLSFFASAIKHNSLPGKKDCEACIEKHPVLNGRSWTDVKFCVKNHLSKINKVKQPYI